MIISGNGIFYGIFFSKNTKNMVNIDERRRFMINIFDTNYKKFTKRGLTGRRGCDIINKLPRERETLRAVGMYLEN